jgi:hypothetical protein
MIKSILLSLAAALVLAVAPLSAAYAAPAVKVPPNPCASFTTKSADKLFGLKSGTSVSRKLTHQGKGKQEIRVCTVRHGHLRLSIDTTFLAGGFGGPLKCYKRPKLGAHGIVCVSDNSKFAVSFARYERHKVWFSDDLNKTLPSKGARMYAFALAQSRAYKG